MPREFSFEEAVGDKSTSPHEFSFEEASTPKEFSFEEASGAAPTEKSPGILSSFAKGVVQSGTDFRSLPNYTAATGPETAGPEWSDLRHPIDKLAPKIAYGLGKSAPMLGGAILGGVAGSAAVGGPEDPLSIATVPIGIGLGSGAVSAAQALTPLYSEELKKNPSDPDAAYSKAVERASTEGVFSGASMAAFELKPFSGVVKNLLTQAFGIQPAVSVAGQAAQNYETDKPIDEGLGAAYGSGAIGTAVPLIAHAALSKLVGKPAKTESDNRSNEPPPPPDEPPPPAAGATPVYRPEYNFDTDSYDVHGPDNTPVATDFSTEAAAQRHAETLNNPIAAEAPVSAPAPVPETTFEVKLANTPKPQAPVAEAAPTAAPVSAPRTSTPRAVQYPVQNFLKQRGGVQLGSNLAGELYHMGVNPQTAPGLFKKTGGLSDVDNIPHEEWKLSHAPADETGNYVDRNYVLQSIADERGGKPITGNNQAAHDPASEQYAKEQYLIQAHEMGIPVDGRDISDIAHAVDERRAIQSEGTAPSSEGAQTVIPGAGKISDKTLAERNMQKPMVSEKTQRPADSGLFDVAGRGQGDLLNQGEKTNVQENTKSTTPQESGAIPREIAAETRGIGGPDTGAPGGAGEHGATSAESRPEKTVSEKTSSKEKTGIQEETQTVEPKLPKELSGAKPRYGYKDKQFTLGFDSDIDRALYITAKLTKSAADAKYRQFLKDNGFTDKSIAEGGAKIKNRIKSIAKDADPGHIVIPRGEEAPRIQKSESRGIGAYENHPFVKILDNWRNLAGIKEPFKLIDQSTYNKAIADPKLAEKITKQYGLANDYFARRPTEYGKKASGRYDPEGRILVIDEKMPKQRVLETIAHEMGHDFVENHYNAQPESVRAAVTDAYHNYLKSAKTMRDVQRMKYPRTKADRLPESELNKPRDDYEAQFDEWFADQTARYFNTQKRPLDVVGKYFHDLAQQIKQMLQGLYGKDFVPDASIKKLFDNVVSGIKEHGISGEIKYDTESPLGKIRDTVSRILSDESGTVKAGVHRDVRNLISPTMTDKGAKLTAQSIRKAYGEATRRRAQDEAVLNKFAIQASKLKGADLADFYNYVEGRSSGAKLANPELQAMADGVRLVYERMRTTLGKMPETRQMNFIKDYFAHQWKNEVAAEKFANDFIAAQGSGRSLKKRTIPTIAEGLAAGLELKEPNPVRAVSSYVGSMNNFIASVESLRAIMNDLGGKYYAPGKQPEGYEPLVGRNAERIEDAKVDEESGKIVPARTLRTYAPSGVATIYNRFYSKGLEATKAASAYELARDAVNANTMLELSLSLYHAGTITIQSMNQDLARVSKNIGMGDWTGAVKAAKDLVTPGIHYLEGRKLLQQYQGLKDHGVDMENIAQRFAESNARLGLDPLSQVGHHGGFYKAYTRGELPELIDKLKKQATEGYGTGLVKSGAQVVGRVVSDISHPLFTHYIPRMKISAFGDLMSDWLRQNPHASKEQISAQSVRLADLVEDRFGEMNMDNIFWSRWAKQVAGLTFRAPGWDLGLIRQVGGAPLDIYKMLYDAAHGKKFNPDLLDRPLYLIAASALYAATNSALTWMKTGTPPSEQDLADLINYRTGGTKRVLGRTLPERGVLPGHARELQSLVPIPGKGALSGASEEVTNKVATLPKSLYHIWTNEDWKGDKIYDPKSDSWVSSTPGVAQAAHLAEGVRPFSIENMINSVPGSNLSVMEKAFGVRQAGARIVARKELGNFLESKDRRKHGSR